VTASSCDVLVVGLGAMGSAVTCELARRGLRVVAFDRFSPPHPWGSSHGETRIIREAYFEHPLYVPLVQRAYERWHALARDSGRRLLVTTGALTIGPPDGALVKGSMASAHVHALPHEALTPNEVERRHPALRPPAGTVAIWEPRAGVLLPEPCIESHLRLGARHGATLRCDTLVRSWRAEGSRVSLSTSAGRFDADWLVLAAGAWMSDLLPELASTLSVERQVLHWYRPRAHPGAFRAERLPVFLIEHDQGGILYGIPELPDVGAGVKVARHHNGETTSAASIDRSVRPGEIQSLELLIASFLPGLAGGWQRASVCMYTNTPDEHFLIDRHPALPNVLVISACSGHGFKFAPVVGEVAADLITGGASRFDLTPFRFGRFQGG
jgi:sarcosine oxidase